MPPAYDVAVIGAGIAGASAAAELAATARVALLEMEDRPGRHTTGRSAALFSKTYGPAPIRALSRASEAFFDAPPEGFAGAPLLSPRGVLYPARGDQLPALEAMLEALSGRARLRRLSAAEARALCPLLRPDYAAAAILDDEARDIDVAALHEGFLRRLRALGGDLICKAEATSLSRDGGGWRIETGAGEIRAEVVVNAAGAWADLVAEAAGVTPVGLVPKRRTALIVAAPEGVDPSPMRMAVDVEEGFYLKPEAGKLLISPADETPAPPSDVQPEEMDIAVCVDRIERAFELSIRRIEHKWAGLRSFVADKAPVAGPAPDAPGFVWLAGQGGYGIQTAPAMGRLAAASALGRPIPQDILDQGLDPADLAPGRPGLGA
ncbi:MAG TPA: FAD-dependent oxidoreductase [Paracoccaceae bacterium]|nr:FAD-dependent oxidoreductase [Paracoccaceae bacterium]